MKYRFHSSLKPIYLIAGEAACRMGIDTSRPLSDEERLLLRKAVKAEVETAYDFYMSELDRVKADNDILHTYFDYLKANR